MAFIASQEQHDPGAHRADAEEREIEVQVAGRSGAALRSLVSVTGQNRRCRCRTRRPGSTGRSA